MRKDRKPLENRKHKVEGIKMAGETKREDFYNFAFIKFAQKF